MLSIFKAPKSKKGKNVAIMASYHKDFDGLTSAVLEKLAPNHSDYQTAVKRRRQ